MADKQKDERRRRPYIGRPMQPCVGKLASMSNLGLHLGSTLLLEKRDACRACMA